MRAAESNSHALRQLWVSSLVSTIPQHLCSGEVLLHRCLGRCRLLDINARIAGRGVKIYAIAADQHVGSSGACLRPAVEAVLETICIVAAIGNEMHINADQVVGRVRRVAVVAPAVGSG